MPRRDRLSSEAYAVADEYRDNRWPGLSRKEWPQVWNFLMDELDRRCPGFAPEEYAKALDQGFTDSR
jgi:hypothetical protein